MTRHGVRLVRQGAEHEVWHCRCGEHRTLLPRHRQVSPGVVQQIIKQLGCLPEGWLQ
jgi:hypothetical protein